MRRQAIDDKIRFRAIDTRYLIAWHWYITLATYAYDAYWLLNSLLRHIAADIDYL